MAKAQTLAEAVNALSPEHSLSTPEELREFFVERPSSPLAKLGFLLTTSNRPEKILFTGHRRCGKSSELAKLSLKLTERYFVVRYSVVDRLNFNDLTYVDVLLSLGLEVFRQAVAEKIGVAPELLDEFFRFLKETTYTTQSGSPASGEFGGEVNALVGKLFARLKLEDKTRREVRETIHPRLTELLEDISLLSASIQAKTGKRVLAIVEDLDKLDPETASTLFYGHGESLARPGLTVIYTFPTALRHHDNFGQIRLSFPSVYVLPNLKIWSRDNKPVDQGLALCREILVRRVEDRLFTPDALVALAQNSGGIPGMLILLARDACLEAMVEGKDMIDLPAATKSIQSVRREYQTRLTQESIGLLREVRQSKTIENTDTYRSLLHNMFVLEFWNDDIWYDVNPIVRPLLDR